MMQRCPRCGGNIIVRYGEVECLHCGRSIEHWYQAAGAHGGKLPGPAYGAASLAAVEPAPSAATETPPPAAPAVRDDAGETFADPPPPAEAAVVPEWVEDMLRPRRRRGRRRKLTREKEIEIIMKVADGYSYEQMEEEYGMDRSTLSRIGRGRF